jgi:hypothetical protein
MAVPKCRECEHLTSFGNSFKLCDHPIWVNGNILETERPHPEYFKRLKTSPKWCPLRKAGETK